MTNRKAIARQSIAAALRTRRKANYGLGGAICVYDLARRLGVDVRFIDIPSMEGMYHQDSEPTIILSALRPPGRRTFTCAHELGHHINGDGTRLDQLVGQWKPPIFDSREFAADCFAGALLMPKMAVERAFTLRGWKTSECDPAQAYIVSNYFGVGYSTLIHHMRSALTLLSPARADALLRVKLRQAQAQAVGWEMSETVWVVDTHWTNRAIDVEVGDLIFVHAHPNSEGNCVEHVQDTSGGRLLCARRPGIGSLDDGSAWSAFVRVSRREYVGRSIYRHWEEADGEGSDDY